MEATPVMKIISCGGAGGIDPWRAVSGLPTVSDGRRRLITGFLEVTAFDRGRKHSMIPDVGADLID